MVFMLHRRSVLRLFARTESTKAVAPVAQKSLLEADITSGNWK